MVLTAYFVLSPATNSSCHRHPRIKGSYKARSGRLASANLTPATGARTTRLCRPLKRRSSCTLADRSRGSSRPATACAPDALASTASRPAFVTIAKRPSVGTGRLGYASDLGQARTEIFLQMGLDRQSGKTRSDLPVGLQGNPGSTGWPRISRRSIRATLVTSSSLRGAQRRGNPHLLRDYALLRAHLRDPLTRNDGASG